MAFSSFGSIEWRAVYRVARRPLRRRERRQQEALDWIRLDLLALLRATDSSTPRSFIDSHAAGDLGEHGSVWPFFARVD
jgi:hypothetical protein